MHSGSMQRALESVIAYCESVVRLENRPSDEQIETCRKILEIVEKELKGK